MVQLPILYPGDRFPISGKEALTSPANTGTIIRMPQSVGPAPGGGTTSEPPSDSQSGFLLHRENVAQKADGAAPLTVPGRGRIVVGQGLQLSFVLTRSTNPTPGQQKRFGRKAGAGGQERSATMPAQVCTKHGLGLVSWGRGPGRDRGEGPGFP